MRRQLRMNQEMRQQHRIARDKRPEAQPVSNSYGPPAPPVVPEEPASSDGAAGSYLPPETSGGGATGSYSPPETSGGYPAPAEEQPPVEHANNSEDHTEPQNQMMPMNASYAFSYESPESSRAEEADENGNVKGNFTYWSDAGEELTVVYQAGKDTGVVFLRDDRLTAKPATEGSKKNMHHGHHETQHQEHGHHDTQQEHGHHDTQQEHGPNDQQHENNNQHQHHGIPPQIQIHEEIQPEVPQPIAPLEPQQQQYFPPQPTQRPFAAVIQPVKIPVQPPVPQHHFGGSIKQQHSKPVSPPGSQTEPVLKTPQPRKAVRANFISSRDEKDFMRRQLRMNQEMRQQHRIARDKRPEAQPVSNSYGPPAPPVVPEEPASSDGAAGSYLPPETSGGGATGSYSPPETSGGYPAPAEEQPPVLVISIFTCIEHSPSRARKLFVHLNDLIQSRMAEEADENGNVKGNFTYWSDAGEELTVVYQAGKDTGVVFLRDDRLTAKPATEGSKKNMHHGHHDTQHQEHGHHDTQQEHGHHDTQQEHGPNDQQHENNNQHQHHGIPPQIQIHEEIQPEVPQPIAPLEPHVVVIKGGVGWVSVGGHGVVVKPPSYFVVVSKPVSPPGSQFQQPPTAPQRVFVAKQQQYFPPQPTQRPFAAVIQPVKIPVQPPVPQHHFGGSIKQQHTKPVSPPGSQFQQPPATAPQRPSPSYGPPRPQQPSASFQQPQTAPAMTSGMGSMPYQFSYSGPHGTYRSEQMDAQGNFMSRYGYNLGPEGTNLMWEFSNGAANGLGSRSGIQQSPGFTNPGFSTNKGQVQRTQGFHHQPQGFHAGTASGFGTQNGFQQGLGTQNGFQQGLGTQNGFQHSPVHEQQPAASFQQDANLQAWESFEQQQQQDPERTFIPLNSQFNQNNVLVAQPSQSSGDSAYKFSYNAGDHSRSESLARNIVSGSYSFVADDGVERTVRSVNQFLTAPPLVAYAGPDPVHIHRDHVVQVVNTFTSVWESSFVICVLDRENMVEKEVSEETLEKPMNSGLCSRSDQVLTSFDLCIISSSKSKTAANLYLKRKTDDDAFPSDVFVRVWWILSVGWEEKLLAELVCLAKIPYTGGGNGAVTDEQLREVSQSLWQADTKNANGAFRLVKQGRTSFGSIQDNAPSKLFEGTTASLWSSSPSISALKTLYDNYEPLVTRPETLTEGEKTEENNFLNAVLNTEVMREAKRFLTSNRLVSVANDAAFRQLLHKLWFGLYSRHRGTPSSSGFEHVFLGEVKQGQVTGFHNWLYFLDQEAKNNVNYLGWLKALSLGRRKKPLKKKVEHPPTNFHSNDSPPPKNQNLGAKTSSTRLSRANQTPWRQPLPLIHILDQGDILKTNKRSN
ncbi:unnamed protein product [Notodromas monacha]|uniref:EndoU domain-containing protein n=1 Tax=Notodromas monacha TaxID=399045 RepID=A0A7R9BXL2_9CRUS|nr:unnamed protein product [Notodromas monacha]CAG0923655.1 unnamed protein product [Notodromas monacha]